LSTAVVLALGAAALGVPALAGVPNVAVVAEDGFVAAAGAVVDVLAQAALQSKAAERLRLARVS
jgi:cysteine synthase